MKELKDIAVNYAAERTNEIMTIAIAQAYADGYRDGYKDREEEIPVDLRNDKTEYVDLGLPSGTLWSNDYEKENGKISYIPFGDAINLNIPTEDQWEELLKTCNILWSPKNFYFECVGPNGNFVTFSEVGYKVTDDNNRNGFAFWINSETLGQANKSASLVCGLNGVQGYTYPVFVGYKLPIRLVKAK